MSLTAEKKSIFLDQAADAFRLAFSEEPERFADLIGDEMLKKDYHMSQERWIADYLINLNRLNADDMLPQNQKYLYTARIYTFQERYYVEKLIRNQNVTDVSLSEMKHILNVLYKKGIGVRLSASFIHVWNGRVRFRVLYPSFVASKEQINQYYADRLAKLYHREPEEMKEILTCELF